MTARLKVSVRYHAAARELCGGTHEELEVLSGTDASALLECIARRHPEFAPLAHRMRVAIADEFVALDAVIPDGAAVDILPPIAGGAGRIQDTPLSVDACLSAVMRPGAGGVTVFLGVVRDHAEGKAVDRLDYEAHESMADKILGDIEAEAAARFAGAKVRVVHRVGELAIGELAVVVAASAPHRAESFEACRYAIEELKLRAPVWKREWHPGQEPEWVNLEVTTRK